MNSNYKASDKRKANLVDNIYRELKKETKKAFDDHMQVVSKINGYLKDGLSYEECKELLVIEGINKDSAESYIQMAKNNEENDYDLNTYSFQFEDVYGRIWSSNDIGLNVTASDEREAWEKAEIVLFENPSVETERIILVEKVF